MYVTAILLYIVFIVGIGIFYKRYVKGIEDFALAGRSLGTPVLLGTLFATLVGGATVVGYTGSFYLMGLDWWFSAIGAILGILVAAIILAEKFRKFEQFTVPDMLAMRYDNRSRYVSGFMIIFGDIAVVTVQILSMTGIMVAFLGMDKLFAMLISVIAFTLITFFGGMKGVAITDSIQAILIFGGLFLGMAVLYYMNGGFGVIFNALPDGYFKVFTSTNALGAFNMAIATFGTAAVSQSIIFARVFSAKDSKTAKRSLYLLIPTAFFGFLFVSLLGYGARAILGPDLPPDQVFPLVVTELLPPFVGGVLLAVVIAAIITSTNSILLSASVNLSRDFYQQIVKKDASSRELKTVGQTAVVVFALISFALAYLMPDIVTAIVFAYTMYTAGLLIPMYVGFLWKGATATAGMYSIIGGGGTALIWYILKQPFGLPPMIPSLIVSLAAIIFISLFTKKPTKEQLQVFDVK
ncbi:Na+/solute symporter [Bacillus sp. OxB-1]|uniref:sodium:solute symporter family protein n=1 Tax=Bacillus sp. (strain OxB-1) TaxID=98228 RepID=UPI000581E7A2|nr:sodium:solute symporter family protein [Bacillus sp. OxB-1]BAQ10077.1 Na+/solute symporter [Bacillus sp. OxB-1]